MNMWKLDQKDKDWWGKEDMEETALIIKIKAYK